MSKEKIEMTEGVMGQIVPGAGKREQIIEFELNQKEILNANVSLHYHAKGTRARNLREQANELGTLQHPGDMFEYFTVQAVICPPTRRRVDPPNLYPTVKHLIDGLTDAEWWEDDDWTHMKYMLFSYGGRAVDNNPDIEKSTWLIRLIIQEVE